VLISGEEFLQKISQACRQVSVVMGPTIRHKISSALN